VSVTYPNAGQLNGTFTTLAGENSIALAAQASPAAYAGFERWRVEDDPNDTTDSGDPADPAEGAAVSFQPNPPAAPAGRGFPLSYQVVVSLPGAAFPTPETTVRVYQDDWDQLRQEYLDIPGYSGWLESRTSGLWCTSCEGDHFTHAQYVVGNWTDPAHSLMAATINANVDAVYDYLRTHNGQAAANLLAVTSGYRNPIRQIAIDIEENRHPCDFCGHARGRAVDFGCRDFNGDGQPQTQADEDILRAAVVNSGTGATAVVGYDNHHVHAQW
jgi:hypothetical protein